MYSDPKRWSYLFESYVLLTMMEIHHRPQVWHPITFCTIVFFSFSLSSFSLLSPSSFYWTCSWQMCACSSRSDSIFLHLRFQLQYFSTHIFLEHNYFYCLHIAQCLLRHLVKGISMVCIRYFTVGLRNKIYMYVPIGQNMQDKKNHAR